MGTTISEIGPALRESAAAFSSETKLQLNPSGQLCAIKVVVVSDNIMEMITTERGLPFWLTRNSCFIALTKLTRLDIRAAAGERCVQPEYSHV